MMQALAFLANPAFWAGVGKVIAAVGPMFMQQSRTGALEKGPTDSGIGGLGGMLGGGQFGGQGSGGTRPYFPTGSMGGPPPDYYSSILKQLLQRRV